MSDRYESLGILNNRCHGLHTWLGAMRTMGALPAEDQAWVLMQAVTTICGWVEAAQREDHERRRDERLA